MTGTVVHLIDTGGPGGAETIFLNLVTRLDPEEWRSVAVLPLKDWLWEALERVGIEPVLLSSHGSFDFGYLAALYRLCRKHNADLIQTHLLGSAVYGSVAATALRLPLVCTFHGRKDVEGTGYRQTKSHILRRRQNTFVFVSDQLRSWFVNNLRVPPARSRVIHNGIESERFRPGRNEAVRAQLGAGPEDVLIGAVGNLRLPKDYPTFLRAAAELARRSTRYRFAIIGAGDDELSPQLLELRTQLGLDDRVVFAGFREDIASVMHALDIYALSSSSEGFSLTTVQAMVSGVPVVATRCGGPEEIVADGQTGLLVSTGDPFALANAIERLAKDQQLRSRLAQAGRQIALREYSVDRMVREYAVLYRDRAGARR